MARISKIKLLMSFLKYFWLNIDWASSQISLIHLRKFSRRGCFCSPRQWSHCPLPISEVWMRERRGVSCPHLSLQHSITMTLLSGSTSLQETLDNLAELEEFCFKNVTPAGPTLKCEKLHFLLETTTKKMQFRKCSSAIKLDVTYLNDSSAPSVTVKGWKAATASFKRSKMTNEFTQLSHRQRRPLSPPDNPTKWLAVGATGLFVSCQNTCYKWEMTP